MIGKLKTILKESRQETVMATSDTSNSSVESSAAPLATTKAPSGAKTNSRAKSSGTGANAISLYQSAPLPNTRPIAETNLDLVSGHLPGNRPMTASHMMVMNDDTLPNHRPIMKSDLIVVNTDTLPNHRPVVRSSIDFRHASMILKNRPIASNQIDNPRDLMGFLD
jgi:hypothetical protein